MECTQAPVTRRELRLADERARRRRLFPTRWTSVPGQGPRPTGVALPFSASTVAAVAVAVSAALLGGGAAQAYTDRGELAQHRLAVAAVAHETANRARAYRAERARLEGQAITYAAVRRTEALVVAHAAVATAQTVVASAAADVAPETLTPLDEAMASLAALIEAAPAPISPVPPAVATAGTAAAPGESIVAEPVEVAPATEPAPTSASPTPPGAPSAPPYEASGGEASDAATAPALVDPLDALDLQVSGQMLVAAQVVRDLSAQVQAVADANVAAAAAAATAAATAALAAQSAADELARKVAAADDSPNGAIPADVLCGVPFAPKALLRCDAAQALEELDRAYRADFGTDLTVVGSYRSYAEQVGVKELRGDLAAAPGSSNHGRALAVDFAGFGSVGQFGDSTYLWMKDNAGAFGWNHPELMEPGGGGPQEPWHWEFDTD